MIRTTGDAAPRRVPSLPPRHLASACLPAGRPAANTARVSKSLKNISIVATLTVVSRVLGLVREIFTAAIFGTSALASAFVSGFTLPNLFRRLLGEGALTAAFVPTLTEELEHRQRAGAFALVSQVASWLLVVTGVLVGMAMLGLANADGLLVKVSGWGMAGRHCAGSCWARTSR